MDCAAAFSFTQKSKKRNNQASERSAPIAEGYGMVVSINSIPECDENVNLIIWAGIYTRPICKMIVLLPFILT